MRYKKIVFLLLAALMVRAGFSQPADKSKLDQYFQHLGDNNKLMGAATVLRNGKNIYTCYSGFANIAAKIKPDTNTMYRIGSISKTITATLILKAAEEGKLDLSQSIQTFFPSIAHADQIKIADLLNHHSGIHNFTGGNYINWYTQPKNRHDLVDTIAKGGSDFVPGTKAAYSNSNYVLLSFILEDVYHAPFESILNNVITQPLHLRHFRFGDKQLAVKNKAISYYFEAGWKANAETDLSIPMGAGGIVSSAEDLAKVLNALFQGKIISLQMLNKMKAQTDGFGFGLFEKNIIGKTAYMHDGAIDGFNSFFYYFPEDETVYVLLSNAENSNLDAVNNLALSAIYNMPLVWPTINTYTVSANTFDQYTGRYTSKASPLVIDISTRNNFLLAQPQGQRLYTMEPVGNHIFSHEKTNVTLTFNPAQNEMLLKQGSQTIVFNKQ